MAKMMMSGPQNDSLDGVLQDPDGAEVRDYATAPLRRGNTHPGRGKWQVYPLG